MRDFTKKYILTSIDDIKTVTDGVLAGLDQGYETSDKKRYEITLVINELLVNCFKYTQPSRETPVVLDAYTRGGQLDIRVTDGGQGFEYERRVHHIEKTTRDERLYSESGRGLILVEAFCQEMIYNGSGNSLEVKIAL